MRTNNKSNATRWALLYVILTLALGWVGPLAAAPTYQSKAEASDTTSSLAIGKPTGTVQSDFLLATISARGNTIITPPTGWTQVLRQTTG